MYHPTEDSNIRDILSWTDYDLGVDALQTHLKFLQNLTQYK